MTHDQAVELIAQRVLHWIVSDADFSDYRVFFDRDEITDEDWSEISALVAAKADYGEDIMGDIWSSEALKVIKAAHP